jgi:hypothetical protein
MPGFGYGPFGHGPFGQYDWAKQVLFRDLPAIDRRLDAGIGGGRLELFTDALRPTFDELLRFARRFGDLRDPDRVRTQFQGRIEVNILDSVTGSTGRTIDSRLEDLDTDPFSPLGKVSVGWILKDAAGREYTVNAVHKLRDIGPTVELVGSAELPTSAVQAGDMLTGSVQFVAGSTSAVGTGTLFLAEVSPGDYVAPRAGGRASRVLSVTSNLALVLEGPYQGSTTGLAVSSVVTQGVRGAAVIRPPALIQFLGEDFGLEVDTHEPESFQRSSVHDISQWLSLKGAQKSYDIIAKIAGYRAVAYALWRLDTVPSALPLNEVFEVPPGSGKFYTTLDPLRPRFDEIAADTIPLDLFCWETPDWTTDGITPPPGPLPDGTSVDDAISSYTQAMPILSATDLTGGRWRVRVGPADMHTVAAIGFWYAEFPTIPGVKHFLETLPVEGLPGEWEFEILAGTAPNFGTEANASYQCRIAPSCGYCRASVIRVEVVPVEVFSDPDALLDGVLERLVAKILGVIPAHVRVTEVVQVIGPVQVPINVSVQAVAGRAVTAVASVGFYYDLIPADVIPVDPSHLIVSGSVSTTP